MVRTYISDHPEKFLGQTVGTGQCVSYVEQAAHTPATHFWQQGPKVEGNFSLQKGVAIATFQDGKYQNRTNGDSHAAIYLRQDAVGVWVLDQWRNPHKTQVVHERFIKFRHGIGTPNNDGSAFYVIEHSDE